MTAIELKAYAKINWDLRVLGKREDGFHELDMVMVTVSLFDTLTLEPADSLSFTCSDSSLPTDDRNLVVKAAQLLAKESGTSRGAKIHLTKSIPAGGGMGGGSSDCASALIGLNKLWQLNWPVERLHPLAAQLGSDVPFFLYGGWQHCTGRGEIVEALPGSEKWPPVPLLLVLPPLHVSTPTAYKCLQAKLWDRKSCHQSLTTLSSRINFLLTNLNSHEDAALKLVNDLTGAAWEVEPRLKGLQDVLERTNPGRWLMSGSGAVHFVVPHDKDDGSALRDLILKETGLVTRVITATTVTS